MTQPMLPDSSLLNTEVTHAMKEAHEIQRELIAIYGTPPLLTDSSPIEWPAIRRRHSEAFYRSRAYRSMRERYPVTLSSKYLRGVHTEMFVPEKGVADKNQDRVLINLHGGAFQVGSRTISHLESIPIAAIGEIRVISVDYRMAPEHCFPAGTEDVLAVYGELLKQYCPKNIGIYGCSAGALLASQVIARLHKDGSPLPAAVGMLFAAGCYYGEGDSGHFYSSITDNPITSVTLPNDDRYFSAVAANDPMAFPIYSDETISKFPPSLLISATRDQGLSSVAHTHSRLIASGVTAYLHIWEGLDHAFHYYANLPQSREVYQVVTSFFNSHLEAPRS